MPNKLAILHSIVPVARLEFLLPMPLPHEWVE
jgi:hypothetical protein